MASPSVVLSPAALSRWYLCVAAALKFNPNCAYAFAVETCQKANPGVHLALDQTFSTVRSLEFETTLLALIPKYLSPLIVLVPAPPPSGHILDYIFGLH